MRHEQLVRPIVLTLAVWLGASGLAPAQGGGDWSALDSRLQSFVPGKVNGLTLMVARHGRIIYTRALGNQTPESVLPIASATKMPSGVVIMALVERGLIKLDEPVATYLEGKIDWPADKAAVTTRMLFNHTSGVSVDA
ncbi:MAG TPA: serine hydrolase, partial [Blastocatellia bacterium]|nr:serine hydrolase [Blastocatellia bacterium]